MLPARPPLAGTRLAARTHALTIGVPRFTGSTHGPAAARPGDRAREEPPRAPIGNALENPLPIALVIDAEAD
jgi:hypothetical protein